MTAAKRKRARTLGEIADDMYEERERKRAAESVVKKHEERLDELEQELLAAADKQQLTGGKGTKATFAVSESIVPQVNDWDAFHAFIMKENMLHLLQRRAAVPACRELFELKGAIPGVEKFTKRSINLRSIA